MKLVHVPKLGLYLDVSFAPPVNRMVSCSPMSTTAAQGQQQDDDGVILTPEEEEELEQASIEAEEDMRMGRCIPAAEFLAKFRAA